MSGDQEVVIPADMAATFANQCVTLSLTIRRGPSAGTTRVYCTCGWDRTYKSVGGAARKEREHLALSRGDSL